MTWRPRPSMTFATLMPFDMDNLGLRGSKTQGFRMADGFDVDSTRRIGACAHAGLWAITLRNNAETEV